jgi:hypothetical protein
MHGNVWEWTEDDWHNNYNGAPDNGSAWIDKPRSALRVFRGGSWSHSAGLCRSAYRRHRSPGARYDPLGFRLAFSQRQVGRQIGRQAGRQERSGLRRAKKFSILANYLIINQYDST